MRNLRKALLLPVAATLIVIAAPAYAQTGVAPVKLTGPNYVTVDSKAHPTSPKTTIAHYVVTQSAVSAFDQTYTIVESGHHMMHASTVTILAGNLTAGFNMTPFEAGYTTITVSNANGYVAMDVTIDW